MYLLVCALIVVGVVALDQLTKWLVMLNMEIGESVPVIKGVFNFTYIRNPGAAFGSFSNSRWVFILISTVMIALMIFYLVKYKPASKLFYIPASMIIGGGIGNMIDRLFYGESFGNGTVVDFIDFCAFPNLWSWIFNVADSFVCVSAVVLFGYLFIDILKEEKEAKSKSNNSENNE